MQNRSNCWFSSANNYIEHIYSEKSYGGVQVCASCWAKLIKKLKENEKLKQLEKCQADLEKAKEKIIWLKGELRKNKYQKNEKIKENKRLDRQIEIKTNYSKKLLETKKKLSEKNQDLKKKKKKIANELEKTKKEIGTTENPLIVELRQEKDKRMYEDSYSKIVSQVACFTLSQTAAAESMKAFLYWIEDFLFEKYKFSINIEPKTLHAQTVAEFIKDSAFKLDLVTKEALRRTKYWAIAVDETKRYQIRLLAIVIWIRATKQNNENNENENNENNENENNENENIIENNENNENNDPNKKIKKTLWKRGKKKFFMVSRKMVPRVIAVCEISKGDAKAIFNKITKAIEEIMKQGMNNDETLDLNDIYAKCTYFLSDNCVTMIGKLGGLAKLIGDYINSIKNNESFLQVGCLEHQGNLIYAHFSLTIFPSDSRQMNKFFKLAQLTSTQLNKNGAFQAWLLLKFETRNLEGPRVSATRFGTEAIQFCSLLSFYPNMIEWVEENTDTKSDEILELLLDYKFSFSVLIIGISWLVWYGSFITQINQEMKVCELENIINELIGQGEKIANIEENFFDKFVGMFKNTKKVEKEVGILKALWDEGEMKLKKLRKEKNMEYDKLEIERKIVCTFGQKFSGVFKDFSKNLIQMPDLVDKNQLIVPSNKFVEGIFSNCERQMSKGLHMKNKNLDSALKNSQYHRDQKDGIFTDLYDTVEKNSGRKSRNKMRRQSEDSQVFLERDKINEEKLKIQMEKEKENVRKIANSQKGQNSKDKNQQKMPKSQKMEKKKRKENSDALGLDQLNDQINEFSSQIGRRRITRSFSQSQRTLAITESKKESTNNL